MKCKTNVFWLAVTILMLALSSYKANAASDDGEAVPTHTPNPCDITECFRIVVVDYGCAARVAGDSGGGFGLEVSQVPCNGNPGGQQPVGYTIEWQNLGDCGYSHAVGGYPHRATANRKTSGSLSSYAVIEKWGCSISKTEHAGALDFASFFLSLRVQ